MGKRSTIQNHMAVNPNGFNQPINPAPLKPSNYNADIARC